MYTDVHSTCPPSSPSLWQVDALRGQVSSLRDELQTSSATTAQLQSQLLESRRQREREVHSITVDRDNLHAKVHSPNSSKHFSP